MSGFVLEVRLRVDADQRPGGFWFAAPVALLRLADVLPEVSAVTRAAALPPSWLGSAFEPPPSDARGSKAGAP